MKYHLMNDDLSRGNTFFTVLNMQLTRNNIWIIITYSILYPAFAMTMKAHLPHLNVITNLYVE